jgi:hypothetical protein
MMPRLRVAWTLVDTHTGAGVIRAEPFDAIELDMRRWWGES